MPMGLKAGQPRLTRDEMVAEIRAGRGILHDGEIHTAEDTLPTEADLAKGDPAKQAAVRQALDEHIRSLTAARDALADPAPDPTPAPSRAEAAKSDEAPIESKPKGK